jgi:hypothetical protein
MKVRLLLIFIILSTNSLSAQKIYVLCPKEQIVTPRQGFLEKDTIDLTIFDGRVLTKKSKIECTSENTISLLADFIVKTYPSAIINILDSDQYYKDPIQNRITIKIGIAAYHAAFGADIKAGIGSVGGDFSYMVMSSGTWNAVTAYSIKIYDYRLDSENKQSKDIYKIASSPNMWTRSSTIKNVLNTSYIDANQEVLFFIDDTLMK